MVFLNAFNFEVFIMNPNAIIGGLLAGTFFTPTATGGDSLAVGTKARKVGGSYQATGTIAGSFKTVAGEQRYVFEFDEPKGMLHIFGPSQVEAT